LLLAQQDLKAEGSIKGQIQLDSSWKPVAYLSLIPNLDEMYTMSNNMIIEKANIDSNGRFAFHTGYLPARDKLYRIHISKKGDPPASLIIGGKEENHLFVIANNKSNVMIRDTSDNTFLNDVKVSGYYPNKLFQRVNEMASYTDTLQAVGSALKKEFIRNAVYDKLRKFADTCSHPIVSLYALYQSKFESKYSENQQFYKDYLEEREHQGSSYFKAFRESLPLRPEREWLVRIIIAIAFFGLGILVTHLAGKQRQKHHNPVKNLTVQERKVYALLREGKSNKEISEEFNIGLSTVKSHANSIYSKLKVKSRKELMNLENKWR
jgi:DNA-binding CsgD family transcriptional regulator